MLAITLVTVVVFFPVTLLFGVSKYLFTALALAVVLSLFASYFVAVSVVPLYCAKVSVKAPSRRKADARCEELLGSEIPRRVQRAFERMLNVYDRWVQKSSGSARQVVIGFLGLVLLSFALYPLVGFSFFPRTDAGQFVINVKAPTGTRIELTE